MPKYDEWLKDFLLGKTEVPTLELSDKFAVHSIRRFLEDKDQIWEIAITYTGRLVVRLGHIGADGITVKWDDWVTKHEVEMPKSES
jgi:hypothetical protein